MSDRTRESTPIGVAVPTEPTPAPVKRTRAKQADDGKVRLSYRVPPEVKEKFDAIAVLSPFTADEMIEAVMLKRIAAGPGTMIDGEPKL